MSKLTAIDILKKREILSLRSGDIYIIPYYEALRWATGEKPKSMDERVGIEQSRNLWFVAPSLVVVFKVL